MAEAAIRGAFLGSCNALPETGIRLFSYWEIWSSLAILANPSERADSAGSNSGWAGNENPQINAKAL